MSDDNELLDRIRAGSPDDFAELVRRHQHQVCAILHRYERDPRRLEELAQDTFLKAWRALERFEPGRAPFQHWLSRIAVRVALDHLRQRRRRAAEVPLADLGRDALDWLRRDDEPGELEVRQAGELLEHLMQSLSPAERLVITLMEIEGHSVKEICGLTGSSGVAVRVCALRARAKLRTALRRWEREET